MNTYEVFTWVCDYGIRNIETKEILQHVFNSYANAKKVCDILNLDSCLGA